MDEETIVSYEDYPADDSPDTWHVHDDGWGWGISCDDCRQVRRGDEGASTLPQFNIRHLQRQNELGTTSSSEEREALGDRWNDPTVQRAR